MNPGWLVLPLLFASVVCASVEPVVTRGIVYGEAAGEQLLLDASVPEGAGPFPVAILVHGGGWSSGSRAGSDRPGSGSDITPWFKAFSDAGYVWFSIDYRLAPKHTWPACLEDVRTAVRWVRAHAATYRGDPKRVVIVGHSAGGHLALMAAFLGEGDSAVQAAVGFAPVSDFERDMVAKGGASKSLQMLFGVSQEVDEPGRLLLRENSPINHVRPGLPPVLLLHGDADKTVTLEMSHALRDRIRGVGGVCDLIELPGAPHGLMTWERHMPDYAARMVEWLDAKLAK